MALQPVTDARIWCLQQYRIAREQGATPLQAMLEVFQIATSQVEMKSTADTEWRKQMARRYFGTIAQRAKGETLTAEYWRSGRCLAMS